MWGAGGHLIMRFPSKLLEEPKEMFSMAPVSFGTSHHHTSLDKCPGADDDYYYSELANGMEMISRF